MLLSPSPYEVKNEKELHCRVIFYEHMQMEWRLCLSFLVTAVLPLVTSCCTWIGCVCLFVQAGGTCVVQLGVFVRNIQAGISLCTGISRIALCVRACVCIYVITGKKLRLNSCHTACFYWGLCFFALLGNGGVSLRVTFVLAARGL